MFYSAAIGLLAAATLCVPTTNQTSQTTTTPSGIPSGFQQISIYSNLGSEQSNIFFGDKNSCIIQIPGNPSWTPGTPILPNLPEINPPSDSKPENGDQNNTASAYATEILNLVNAERQKAGLSPLKLSTQLSQAAQIRAKEIQSSFSHTRPNGSSFSTVLNEQGISYRTSGENIAWGQPSPSAVMAVWMNSPSHRANILNANYGTLGVGYGVNASGQPYWVQLFTN